MEVRETIVNEIIRDRRMLLSWMIALSSVVYLLSVAPPRESAFVRIFEVIGFALIIIASFGRVWCALYISGYKSKQLVQDGPYSLVRNPLYLFSLIGLLGVCLGAGAYVLLLFLLPVAIWGYGVTIAFEETKLAKLFGEEFSLYSERTNRYIPLFQNYWSRESIKVHPRKFFRSTLDAMCFAWMILVIEMVESLHNVWGF